MRRRSRLITLRRDQRPGRMVTGLATAKIYCKMIWSDTTLKREVKASRFKGPTRLRRSTNAGDLPVEFSLAVTMADDAAKTIAGIR
jgi:hypothetical protein